MYNLCYYLKLFEINLKKKKNENIIKFIKIKEC